jgi:tight adherence protein C
VGELLYVSVFIFFIAIFILIYATLMLLFRNKLNIKNRIEKIKEPENIIEEPQNISFLQRVIKPVYTSFTKFILQATPKGRINVLSKRLERAGLLKNSSTERWLFNKSIIVVGVPSLFGVLIYIAIPEGLKITLIVMLLMVFINTIFNFYLSSMIETRKKNILKDLPYTLDLITVSVEAGLSFDGAMARVINNIKGDLCDEFSKALKEIRMGIERKIALKNMGERCGVKELSMFITSLIQADDLGVSLGRVLRIEAVNLREHRKQIAREKAMKAPIKMLFPLIFFIFPSIFIIILGPAAINVYNVFFNQ